MIVLVKNSNRSCYNVNTYMVDTEEERDGLSCGVGSTAIMSEDGTEYIKNNQGEWILKTNGSGSGSGGAVASVNGKTGAVVLTAEDVGALSDETELFSGNYNDLSNKPTIPDLRPGAGILFGKNGVTYDPDVLPTVDYVDQSITNLEVYFSQELNNEHLGRVAGDNLKQNVLTPGDNIKIENDTISSTALTFLADGHAFAEWNGVTAGHTIVEVEGEKPSTLVKITDNTIVGGKQLQALMLTINTNGVKSVVSCRDYADGLGEGQGMSYANTTDHVLLLSVYEIPDTGVITITDAGTVEVEETGLYVLYDERTHTYVSKLDNGETTGSAFVQNDVDVTADIKALLSDVPAPPTEDGVYVLRIQVIGGEATTPVWVKEN